MRPVALVLSLGLLGCAPGVQNEPDSGVVDPDAEEPEGPDAEPTDYSRVYAHSGSTLYRIDTVSMQEVEIGPFGAAIGSQSITDIAIDKDDRMIGVTLDAIFEIDEATGAATHLADFTGVDGFTSLCFVPINGLPDSDERLIAANDQGEVYEINPATGAATMVGSYGMHDGEIVRSSGDIVSVRGFGTVATVTLGLPLTNPDRLAWIDPETWDATVIGTGDTSYDKIFGLGFWRGSIYGFVDSGALITLSPETGASTLVRSSAPSWFGAGVTTDAPIVD